jgi:hypothetical protein
MPSASALFLFCPRPRARVDELASGRARAPVGWFGATSIARGLRVALGAGASLRYVGWPATAGPRKVPREGRSDRRWRQVVDLW